MLRAARYLLIMVPNIPNILPRFDTQPFYLLLLWSEYRFRMDRLLALCCLIFLGWAEYALSLDAFNLADLLILTIFFFLMTTVDWSHTFIERFYALLPRLIAAILILTALRLSFPWLEILFSPRWGVDIRRSIPFTFPEASFAAKTFFALFIGFAISLGRVNWVLILGQVLTLSATGMVTGVISIAFAILYDRRNWALKGIGMLALLAFGVIWVTIGNIEAALGDRGGGRLLYMLRAIVESGSIWSVITQDHTFVSRIGAISAAGEAGNLTSIASYALELPVTFAVAGFLYVYVVLIQRSLTPVDIMARLVALGVIGYADSYLYPAVIFVLTCRPYRRAGAAGPLDGGPAHGGPVHGGLPGGGGQGPEVQTGRVRGAVR